MPTIDERCYGHQPAQRQLDSLRSQIGNLKAQLRKAERGHEMERSGREKWEKHCRRLIKEMEESNEL